MQAPNNYDPSLFATIYNTKHKCTYWDQSTLKTETDEEDEIEMYQTDFLNIFYLKEFNLEKMNWCVETIYEQLKTNKEIISILTKICDKLKLLTHMNNDDAISQFMFLFSFEYLYVMHPFLSYLLEKNNHNLSLENDSEYKTLFNQIYSKIQ
jgi:hypothetical protein